MPAYEYGRSLKGLGINMVVANVGRTVAFQTRVLEAEVVYADADFAVLRACGSEWMVHADHTYDDHELKGSLGPDIVRGIGIELRLHGCDPDKAEARARDLGYTILAGAMDKPHGLREVYILDGDGYLWVPDAPIGD